MSDEHVEFPTMVEHTPNEKLSLESPPPSYISSPKDDEKPMSFADFDRMFDEAFARRTSGGRRRLP